MTTKWICDTCDCVIEFNGNIQWVKSHSHCRLHKGLRGQNHLDTVLAQNQRFNISMGLGREDLTPEEERIIELSREVNKRRIRIEDVRNFVEDIPDRPVEMNIGFWQNLRNRFPI